MGVGRPNPKTGIIIGYLLYKGYLTIGNAKIRKVGRLTNEEASTPLFLLNLPDTNGDGYFLSPIEKAQRGALFGKLQYRFTKSGRIVQQFKRVDGTKDFVFEKKIILPT